MFGSDDPHRYDDMLRLPHHVSFRHPRMSMNERAAMFSPFAALTGYEAAVAEAARLTDRKIELDENQKAILDEKLRIIRERLDTGAAPRIMITWFLPDARKAGGSYETVSDELKKIDLLKRSLLLQSGMEIPIDEILDVDLDEASGLWQDLSFASEGI